MSGIMIDGIEAPFVCFDAHLDQYGPQSGDWGSAEQLAGMGDLGGALRVLFCERGGKAPSDRCAHEEEAQRIKDDLMPREMPLAWTPGETHWLHVEGMESFTTARDGAVLLDVFHAWGVRGANPIYHQKNPLGGCSKEPGAGLSTLGHWLLHELWRREWWIDLAHMSHASMRDAQRIWKGEVPSLSGARLCYTHGGILHHGAWGEPMLTPGNIERCIPFDLARDLAVQGGLVCLSPARPFYPNLDAFLDHLCALGAAVDDWEGIGIGTDYGGILDPWRFPGCATVAACFTTVIRGLAERGVAHEHIRKVVGENARLFFMKAPSPRVQ